MDIVVSGFKGEIPILDVQALPDNHASEAKNCDFRSGVLRSLPAYLPINLATSVNSAKVFFLSGSNPATIKSYLAVAGFSGVPAPSINDDRVVFVYSSGTPYKATLDDFANQIGTSGFYTALSPVRPLGVPAPTAPLELQKVPTYCNFFSYKIYYKNDIVHWVPTGGTPAYRLYICKADSSTGERDEVYNVNKALSDWTPIWRQEDILNDTSGEAATSHKLGWCFRETNGRPTANQNTQLVLGKGDLGLYKDENVYRARFDFVNRNRPIDTDVWKFLGDAGVKDTNNADSTSAGLLSSDSVRLYSENKVYARGDAVYFQYGSTGIYDAYFIAICNVGGTSGVHPLHSYHQGRGRWGIVCRWANQDHFNLKATSWTHTQVNIFIRNIKDEDDVVTSGARIVLPYMSTYSFSEEGRNWYAIYKYLNEHSEVKYGVFKPVESSSNIRPFNPEWGGVNPWELYRTKEEIAIDREEVYETIAYVWTYVTAWGEESKPSPVTEVIDANLSEKIQYKTPVAAFPNAHITGFRVYRLSSGMKSAEYFLFQDDDFDVDDLDEWLDDVNASESHIKPAKELVKEVLQTEHWDEPDTNLKGFVSLANGCIAGHVGNRIYPSEPWVYYAFPKKYEIVTQSQIIGLGSFNNTIIACTTAHPEVINCPMPEQTSVKISPHTQPCLSVDSIVSGENYVIYASHNGLAAVGQDGIPQVLTKNLIDEEVWRATFKPEDIAGAYFSGRYWGVIKGTKTGFVIPFNNPDNITKLDVGGVSGYPDLSGISINPYTGDLYLIGYTGTNVHLLKFGKDGSTYLPWAWQSKMFTFDYYVGHSSYRVDRPQGDEEDVVLKYYRDSSEVLSVSLDSSEPGRLPSGKSKNIQFRLEGDSEAKVHFVKLSQGRGAM